MSPMQREYKIIFFSHLCKSHFGENVIIKPRRLNKGNKETFVKQVENLESWVFSFGFMIILKNQYKVIVLVCFEQ